MRTARYNLQRFTTQIEQSSVVLPKSYIEEDLEESHTTDEDGYVKVGNPGEGDDDIYSPWSRTIPVTTPTRASRIPKASEMPPPARKLASPTQRVLPVSLPTRPAGAPARRRLGASLNDYRTENNENALGGGFVVPKAEVILSLISHSHRPKDEHISAGSTTIPLVILSSPCSKDQRRTWAQLRYVCERHRNKIRKFDVHPLIAVRSCIYNRMA